MEKIEKKIPSQDTFPVPLYPRLHAHTSGKTHDAFPAHPPVQIAKLN